MIRWLRFFIWNTIIGLFVLLIANLFNHNIGYPWWGILLSAVGGVPGALLTILLKLLVVH